MATRSPTPASPAKVFGSAPAALPNAVNSARPRVSIIAAVFSPYPAPRAMPTASATTFLSDPHISRPMTSVVTKGLKYLVSQAFATVRALSMSAQPTTVAAGWRSATCLLRFGPEIATNRSSGRFRDSRTTWSMRLSVARSMPFIRETTSAVDGIRSLNSASATRANWAAIATTMISACATACARSPVASMVVGSCSTLGRRYELR